MGVELPEIEAVRPDAVVEGDDGRLVVHLVQAKPISAVCTATPAAALIALFAWVGTSGASPTGLALTWLALVVGLVLAGISALLAYASRVELGPEGLVAVRRWAGVPLARWAQPLSAVDGAELAVRETRGGWHVVTLRVSAAGEAHDLGGGERTPGELLWLAEQIEARAARATGR